MNAVLHRVIAAAVTVAALALTGCASTYTLDNNVQSFASAQNLPAAPSYRFERLPSQAAQPSQPQIEALADPALFKAGFKRDDAAPKYSVQVSARVQRVLSPWADPWDGYGYWRHGWGPGWGPRWGWHGWSRYEQPWYQREVSVVLRELPSNKVVFESRAANDGPWGDNKEVLTAMFEAALQGFPNPPAGPRRVDVQVGGR